MIEKATEAEIRQIGSEEQVREKARAVYMTLPVVSLLAVSRHSGAPITQIKQWIKEDKWVEQRSKLYADKKADIIKKVGSPRDAFMQDLEICNQIADYIKHNLKVNKDSKRRGYKISTRELDAYTKVMTNVSKLRERIYKELGVSKRAE